MACAQLSASRAQTRGIGESTPQSFPVNWNYVLSLKDKHLHFFTLPTKSCLFNIYMNIWKSEAFQKAEGGLRQWRQWSLFSPHLTHVYTQMQLLKRSQVVTMLAQSLF